MTADLATYSMWPPAFSALSLPAGLSREPTMLLRESLRARNQQGGDSRNAPQHYVGTYVKCITFSLARPPMFWLPSVPRTVGAVLRKGIRVMCDGK